MFPVKKLCQGNYMIMELQDDEKSLNYCQITQSLYAIQCQLHLLIDPLKDLCLLKFKYKKGVNAREYQQVV